MLHKETENHLEESSMSAPASDAKVILGQAIKVASVNDRTAYLDRACRGNRARGTKWRD
jgi:hypothetical protein